MCTDEQLIGLSQLKMSDFVKTVASDDGVYTVDKPIHWFDN